jgi:hypothetical protein
MANDSSTIDIDSLALKSVTGGRILIPGGGGYGGPPPKPPAGGSLTLPDGKTLSCPAGTAPDYESITATGRTGFGPFGFPVTYHHVSATCQKIK